MNKFYAQPLAHGATGFSFSSSADFEDKRLVAQRLAGICLDEFEISLSWNAGPLELAIWNTHQDIDQYEEVLSCLVEVEQIAYVFLRKDQGFNHDDAVELATDFQYTTVEIKAFETDSELITDFIREEEESSVVCSPEYKRYIDWAAIAFDRVLNSELVITSISAFPNTRYIYTPIAA